MSVLLALLAALLGSVLTIEWSAVLGFLGAIGTVGFTLAAVLSASTILLLWRLSEPAPTSPPRRHPLVDVRDGASFVWDERTDRRLRCGHGDRVGVDVPCRCCVAVRSRDPGGARRVGAGRCHDGQHARVSTSGATALSFILFGAEPMVWTITSTTLRQSVTPSHMLGRVSAVNTGARPLGAALGWLVGGDVGRACVPDAEEQRSAVACYVATRSSSVETMRTLGPKLLMLASVSL
jgi:hypothetical protein